MGTSGAWGGSGGSDWGRVRDQVESVIDSGGGGGAADVVDPLLDAIDWVDDAPAQDAADPVPQVIPQGPYVSPRGGRGSGGGGGTGRGGVIFGPSRSGSSKRGGGRRSRATVAGVGGRVISAGLALRRGDAETLRDLGLDLGELRALSPFKQVNRILNVLVGSGAAVEEAELRAANSRALRQLVLDGISGAEAIRVLVVEYVMQVYSSECGESSRDGSRPGGDTVEVERQLRSALRARVAQLDIPADAVSGKQLAAIIEESLKTMRRIRPK